MQACSVDSDTKTCAGSYGACREAMLEILGEQTDDVVDGDDGDDDHDVVDDSRQFDIFLIQPEVNPGCWWQKITLSDFCPT